MPDKPATAAIKEKESEAAKVYEIVEEDDEFEEFEDVRAPLHLKCEWKDVGFAAKAPSS